MGLAKEYDFAYHEDHDIQVKDQPETLPDGRIQKSIQTQGLSRPSDGAGAGTQADADHTLF